MRVSRRMGEQSFLLDTPPVLSAWASIVADKEGQGPLGTRFDQVIEDDLWGEKTWEQAESKMSREACMLALQKCGKTPEQMQLMLGGDLLNQLTATGFGARELGVPFIGLYGACSTFALSLLTASLCMDTGAFDNALCVASSHFSSAERQYRNPLELGNQRPVTAQWTVTGAGSVVLEKQGSGPRLAACTLGKVVDLGISDPNNMGAAMAPAAVDTIVRHLKDTGRKAGDYDAIFTGDLGKLGKTLCQQMAQEQGYPISRQYDDCGCMIFDPEQDVHAGASGCGCSAVVTCAAVLPKLKSGSYRRVLLVATGALLSQTTSLQGESIPSIAHAVELVAEGVPA